MNNILDHYNMTIRSIYGNFCQVQFVQVLNNSFPQSTKRKEIRKRKEKCRYLKEARIGSSVWNCESWLRGKWTPSTQWIFWRPVIKAVPEVVIAVVPQRYDKGVVNISCLDSKEREKSLLACSWSWLKRVEGTPWLTKRNSPQSLHAFPSSLGFKQWRSMIGIGSDSSTGWSLNLWVWMFGRRKIGG
jgi:hypothetical protein